MIAGDLTGLEPAPLGPQERARFLRVGGLPGVELLSARFLTQRYLPHAHDGLTLALIERGAEQFRHRGTQMVAGRGEIAVILPGELHTGEAAAAGGWAYRVLYLRPDWLPPQARGAGFRQTVFRDDGLATLLRQAHASLLTPGTSPLAQEVWLRRVLTHLVAAHGDGGRLPPPPPAAPEAVRAARDVLDACPEAPLSLRDLATRVGLSPAHLARSFRAALGVAPHTYQMTARARRARELLDAGEAVAAAALAAGFADQSHLSRVFKRVYGVPPGNYLRAVGQAAHRHRRIVQDSP